MMDLELIRRVAKAAPVIVASERQLPLGLPLRGSDIFLIGHAAPASTQLRSLSIEMNSRPSDDSKSSGEK